MKRCRKCGTPLKGHARGYCLPVPESSNAQLLAKRHPLFPHLGGIIKRSWRSMMTETMIAGSNFHSVKTLMSPEKSGALVGTLFELYFQRELENLGLGLGFYIPRTKKWGEVGNHLDVLHMSVPEYNIEIKTTREKCVSQRRSSAQHMQQGYYLLSIQYDWIGKDTITARFGWIDPGDWSRNAGPHGLRLNDDVYWNNHVSVF